MEEYARENEKQYADLHARRQAGRWGDVGAQVDGSSGFTHGVGWMSTGRKGRTKTRIGVCVSVAMCVFWY